MIAALPAWPTDVDRELSESGQVSDTPAPLPN